MSRTRTRSRRQVGRRRLQARGFPNMQTSWRRSRSGGALACVSSRSPTAFSRTSRTTAISGLPRSPLGGGMRNLRDFLSPTITAMAIRSRPRSWRPQVQAVEDAVKVTIGQGRQVSSRRKGDQPVGRGFAAAASTRQATPCGICARPITASCSYQLQYLIEPEGLAALPRPRCATL